MWKVWKEIIPFRTSYFANMTKYALVDWYNFTWNCYLLPWLQGCEESGLFFMVFWKVILKQEDFFPVTRCLSFDQLSSILPAPTPPPPSTRHLVVTWCNVTLKNALFYFHSIILKIHANIKTPQPLLQTLIETQLLKVKACMVSLWTLYHVQWYINNLTLPSHKMDARNRTRVRGRWSSMQKEAAVMPTNTRVTISV